MAFDKTKFYAKFVDDSKEQLEEINNILVEFEGGEGDEEKLQNVLRLLHTLKGASKMLGFKQISEITHKLEDVFAAYKKKTISDSKPLYNLTFKTLDIMADLLFAITSPKEVTFDYDALCADLEKAAKGEFKQAEVKTEVKAEAKAEVKAEPTEKVEQPSPAVKSANNKFTSRFIEDSRAQLEKMKSALPAYEKDSADNGQLEIILPLVGTMKDGAKMLGFSQIGAIGLNLEKVFYNLKASKISPSPALHKLIYKTADVLSDLVQSLGDGRENSYDHEPLCENLMEAAKGNVKDAAEPDFEEQFKANFVDAPVVESKVEPQEADAKIVERQEKEAPVKKEEIKTGETIKVDAYKLDDAVRLLGEMVSSQQRFKQNLFEIETELKSFGNFVESVGAYEDTGLMMNDLSKIYMRFKEIAGKVKDNLNHQNILDGELRGKVLHLRMMPVSTVLNTYKRLVRDLSESLGKEVTFTITGGHTELDKIIVEGIKDPLLHIVRNCIDHGLETPEERKAAGKPPAGKLHISAGYDGGSAMIKIEDDGKGISLENIRKKAVKVGLYTEEELFKMADRDIINLIFLSGFSTSKIITDISGRGVGMDVVKDNIVNKLKGEINVDTKEGRGTTFYLRLPLTLSIMRILMFDIAGRPYGMTVSSVYEILTLEKEDVIDVVNKKVLKLRDQLIPLMQMNSLLQTGLENEIKENATVMILNAGDNKLGVIVDNLIDELDMEIKSLPGHMKNNQLFLGATITGKNEILLIFNSSNLVQIAKKMRDGSVLSGEKTKVRKQHHILVVDDSVSTRDIEKSILESYGYLVDIAGDGVEGMKKASQHSYDMIITDIEMPRMDGFSFTEKLRKTKNFEATPIIIVSSRNSDEDKRRGIEVGADAYIIKGDFEESKLMETVQCLLH